MTARDRLIAHLPRYARTASGARWLTNLPNRLPGLAALRERLAGFSARRKLPEFAKDNFRDAELWRGNPPDDASAVVLFADTFTRWFEPENARAATRVLKRAGYTVCAPTGLVPPFASWRQSLEHSALGDHEGFPSRPLCCGRTFLAAGLVGEARIEARRMLLALSPYVERGIPIVGLEPSCLLTLRDEYRALLPGPQTDALAGRALLLEEFLDGKDLPLKALPQTEALVHGHCHQKAFGTHAATLRVLGAIPGLAAKTFDSTCCGMAGSFGYEAEHYEVSMKIGELGVLPAMRAAPAETLLVASGTSCRHQIRDGAGREAVHLARALDAALA
jgi:Fe-S oxidoreductase